MTFIGLGSVPEGEWVSGRLPPYLSLQGAHSSNRVQGIVEKDWGWLVLGRFQLLDQYSRWPTRRGVAPVEPGGGSSCLLCCQSGASFENGGWVRGLCFSEGQAPPFVFTAPCRGDQVEEAAKGARQTPWVTAGLGLPRLCLRFCCGDGGAGRPVGRLPRADGEHGGRTAWEPPGSKRKDCSWALCPCDPLL